MTDIKYEKILLNKYLVIGGMDEVGRGPLAGPVVTACVVLKNPVKRVYKIRDSKALDAPMRKKLFEKITDTVHGYSITIATQEEVDRYNILRATQISMNRAFHELTEKPGIILIDGKFSKPFEFKSECIIKGDDKHYSIAAASILAKVYRDNLMIEYDKEYPEYGFAKHKGYGTKQHLEAIEKYGLCPIHRKTFMQQLKLF